DPDYKYPEILRGNLAIDRELPFFGLLGTAEFVFANNVKDIYYQNINFVSNGTTTPDGRTVYKRFDANLNDVMFLSNSGKGSSWSLSFKVDRPFRNGLLVQGSYSYGDAHSITDGTSSVARSNWTTNPISLDTNNPALTRSNYSPASGINTAPATPPTRRPAFRAIWAAASGALPRSSTTAGPAVPTRSSSTATRISTA